MLVLRSVSSPHDIQFTSPRMFHSYAKLRDNPTACILIRLINNLHRVGETDGSDERHLEAMFLNLRGASPAKGT
jgi:hypothetical protein